LTGNFGSNREKNQAIEESRGAALFTGSKTGINFREVYRTTREIVSLIQEMP
jgi:hypothetical protein